MAEGARARALSGLLAGALALAAVAAGAEDPPEESAEQAPPASLVGATPPTRPARQNLSPPLLYGLLTGHLPFQVRGAGEAAPPAAAADAEAARGDLLEEQIEAEIRRQDDLMRQIERVDRAGDDALDPLAAAALAARVDPRVAPTAPAERDLPLAIFDAERVSLPAGTWESPVPLELLKRTLDADRDGSPEQVRYYRPSSEEMLRVEKDRDFDGRLDAWSDFEGGALAARTLDTDGDGRPDTWERYADGRMRERSIDRDGDGVRDAFYDYEAGLLVEERHDPDNDGRPNLLVSYADRHRVRSEEDRSGDGRIDTWTTWRVAGDEEIVARIERDTGGDGRPDVIETFVEKDGVAVLSLREEDADGDGAIDVTSIYENGKLVRRQIAELGKADAF